MSIGTDPVNPSATRLTSLRNLRRSMVRMGYTPSCRQRQFAARAEQPSRERQGYRGAARTEA